MKWLPIKNPAGIDQYAIRSGCGDYTVCKVTVMGKTYYRTHKGKEEIGISEDIGEAKGYAEHHENGDGV